MASFVLSHTRRSTGVFRLSDVRIDLKDIPLWIPEEQGAVSIIPTTRCLNDLDLLSKQLCMAGIHLSGCNAEDELEAGSIRKFQAIVRTSAPARGERDSPHPHLQPIIPVTVNGKAQDLKVNGPHTRHILAQKHNIVEVANCR
jgi:hypothetical protein